MITVTDEGSEGSSRDHATFASPIFGRRNLQPNVTANREFFVNLIACRVSRRDLNRGGPIRAPFSFPVTGAKKFRYAVFTSANAGCNTTLDTSPSQARSGVALEAVSRFDNSASLRRSLFSNASIRAARASLYSTRAQPNA
ncbi:hypothetical protein [Nocardia shimofusensis]|uniref:hypothetical protein n=1 Tax=Nocardia shimofusensis TaxID=228596 RepID=UPI000830E472|nr:hypothetical protein [Nocardia shimofusensis]